MNKVLRTYNELPEKAVDRIQDQRELCSHLGFPVNDKFLELNECRPEYVTEIDIECTKCAKIYRISIAVDPVD